MKQINLTNIFKLSLVITIFWLAYAQGHPLQAKFIFIEQDETEKKDNKNTQTGNTKTPNKAFQPTDQNPTQLIENENKSLAQIVNIQKSIDNLNQTIDELKIQNQSLDIKLANLRAEIATLRLEDVKLAERLELLKNQTQKQVNISLVLYKKSTQNTFLNLDFFSNFIRNQGILDSLNKKTLLKIDDIVRLKLQLQDNQATISSKINDFSTLQKESQKKIVHLEFEQEQKKIFLDLLKKNKSAPVNLASITQQQLNQIRNTQKLSKASNTSLNKVSNSYPNTKDAVTKNTNQPNKNNPPANKNNTLSENKVSYNTTIKNNNLPWPIKGKVLQKFKPTKKPYIKAYRTGILINPQSSNSNVNAVMAGKVIGIKLIKDNLYSVLIEHATGIYSVYSLLDAINVSLNQRIPANSTIGQISHYNNDAQTSEFLYFELQINYQAVDPLIWLTKN